MAEDDIPDITSVLTVVCGRIVHGIGPFAPHAPALPAPMPDWSPVNRFGGYQGGTLAQARAALAQAHGPACRVHAHDHAGHGHAAHHAVPTRDLQAFWGALGCACFAF